MIFVNTTDLDRFFNVKDIRTFKVIFIDTTFELNDQERINNEGRGKMLRVVLGPGDDFVENGVDRYPDDNHRIVIDFYNDYFFKCFEMSLNTFIKEIDSTLSTPSFSHPEMQYYYLQIKLEKLEAHISTLLTLNHLESLKDIMKKTMEEQIRQLKTRQVKKYEDLEVYKIKFNLKKREVCLIFDLLNTQGRIDGVGHSRAALGQILDMHFMYQDPGSKTHKIMIDSHKTIEKNKSLHRQEDNINTIKTIFGI